MDTLLHTCVCIHICTHAWCLWEEAEECKVDSRFTSDDCLKGAVKVHTTSTQRQGAVLRWMRIETLLQISLHRLNLWQKKKSFTINISCCRTSEIWGREKNLIVYQSQSNILWSAFLKLGFWERIKPNAPRHVHSKLLINFFPMYLELHWLCKNLGKIKSFSVFCWSKQESWLNSLFCQHLTAAYHCKQKRWCCTEKDKTAYSESTSGCFHTLGIW